MPTRIERQHAAWITLEQPLVVLLSKLSNGVRTARVEDTLGDLRVADLDLPYGNHTAPGAGEQHTIRPVQAAAANRLGIDHRVAERAQDGDDAATSDAIENRTQRRCVDHIAFDDEEVAPRGFRDVLAAGIVLDHLDSAVLVTTVFPVVAEGVVDDRLHVWETVGTVGSAQVLGPRRPNGDARLGGLAEVGCLVPRDDDARPLGARPDTEQAGALDDEGAEVHGHARSELRAVASVELSNSAAEVVERQALVFLLHHPDGAGGDADALPVLLHEEHVPVALLHPLQYGRAVVDGVNRQVEGDLRLLEVLNGTVVEQDGDSGVDDVGLEANQLDRHVGLLWNLSWRWTLSMNVAQP